MAALQAGMASSYALGSSEMMSRASSATLRTSFTGASLPATTSVQMARPSSRQAPGQIVCMGNKHEGKGIFAPIVVLTKNVVGQKQFNQLRGKGIALHSQVITEFCKSIGADAKQRQGLIRLAKKNGEKLGFLA